MMSLTLHSSKDLAVSLPIFEPLTGIKL